MTAAGWQREQAWTPGRGWHALTALVALGSLLLQLVLVVGQDGGPGLGTRLIRFVGYFTVQSNLLVLLSTGLLALRPALDAWWLRVLRLDAIAGIAVTAGVHAVVLRPLQDLHGADLVADTGLHVVVPALAVVGWLACGPRRRVDVGTVVLALVWPVVYVAGTALHGAVSHWYPYPFTDVDELGYPTVLRNAAGVLVLLLLVCLLLLGVDRVLGSRRPPREVPTYTARS
ncbi:Pr6Pr family membrane protein [Angustibacter aerolatus]